MDELEKIRKRKMEKLIKSVEADKMETEIEVKDADFNEKVIEAVKSGQFHLIILLRIFYPVCLHKWKL